MAETGNGAKTKPRPEREFEIGRDESWSLNNKRLFDEMMQESLETQRRTRLHFDKLFSDAQTLTAQLMQNAVENANTTAKQTIRHADIAIDRQWNLDEQSTMATILARNLAASPPFMELLATALAKGVQGEPAGE